MPTSRLISILVFPWSLALAALLGQPRSQVSPCALDRDDVVYAAALDSVAEGKGMLLVADSMTGLGKQSQHALPHSIPTRRVSYILPTAVLLPPEQDHLPREDYWAAFQRRFPGADGWF